MRSQIYIASCLLPVLILIHLWAAPYTKVEESFNIQATHDFLTYGLPITHGTTKIKGFFDHMKFPGAVPRTFTGAMVLSGIATQFSRALGSDLPQKQTVGMYHPNPRRRDLLTRLQSERCWAVSMLHHYCSTRLACVKHTVRQLRCGSLHYRPANSTSFFTLRERSLTCLLLVSVSVYYKR
jgi:hypothetical protein